MASLFFCCSKLYLLLKILLAFCVSLPRDLNTENDTLCISEPLEQESQIQYY